MKNDLHLHLNIDGTLWTEELPSPCLVMVQWDEKGENVILTVDYERRTSSITIHPDERIRISAALIGNAPPCDCKVCLGEVEI